MLSLPLSSQQTKVFLGSLKLLIKEKDQAQMLNGFFLNEAISAKRNMLSPQHL